MPLLINIHDIKESKAGQIQGIMMIRPQELDLPALDGTTWQNLCLDYVLTNAGNLYVLQGKLETIITQDCSRCLKPVSITLVIDIQEQFSRLSRAGNEEILRFAGEEIDITEVLREYILLNLPVKPLCAPDCRGLCPHCGIDRNTDSCDCNPKSVDPRLAALEKLITK